MYWGQRERPPPHFHALRAEEVLIVDIRELTVREGNASKATERKVLAWAQKRQAELLENWERLQKHQPPEPIDP